MDELEFKVQGNEGEYLVSFRREQNNLTAFCTCEAGEHGLHCRHRIALMTGDDSMIISPNKNDITKLLAMVKGSDVEGVLGDVLRLESELEVLKKELTKQKHKLARKMID